MSRRPAPVGKDASKGRLKAVLAAGLVHHGRPRPAPTDARNRELDSDDEESLPLTERPAYKRKKRPPSPPPANLLGELPPDLIMYILSYTNGMSCEKIAELREIDIRFREMLRSEDFWKWQCQLRNYDREDRLFPTADADQYWTPAPPPGMAKVAYRGSWRAHYEWWCTRAFSNDKLRYVAEKLLIYIAQETPSEDWAAAGFLSDDPDYIVTPYGPIKSWDVSQVTDMTELFVEQVGVNAAAAFEGDLSLWDVSNVTSMRDMFRGCQSFNCDLSNWDVSSVTNMSSMFSGASSFKCLGLFQWDVSNVTDMRNMFAYSTRFNGDISKWDVSSVTNMKEMFLGATSFNGDLSNWDTSSVTDMSGMFAGVTSFNGDLSKWDVSNVTNMRFMFLSATSFNGDISNWNVSNVTIMQGMFMKATRFTSNLSNWDVSKVTTMTGMFNKASSFNGDLSKWDVSNVRGMTAMFGGASSYNPPPGYGLGERAGAMEVG